MGEGVHIFGVRHHGPGSARSLVRALDELGPDIVLVEGPPDAEGVLELAGHEGMKPPVAMLVYVPEKPRRAVYYPLAAFSPEWQAIRYALRAKVPVRFMDLPQAIQMAEEEGEKKEEAVVPAAERVAPEEAGGAEGVAKAVEARRDPLQFLAEAAGYSDGERWWEHVVEERQESGEVFAAILEAMTALRNSGVAGTPSEAEALRESRREAYMRQTIRAARKEGFARIAVVCGAWHAPVLVPEKMPAAKDDAAVLKGLAKVKVAATWVPWTHGRLTFSSGYGAGVGSPGWYQHLWERGSKSPSPQPSPGLPGEGDRESRRSSIHWMTRVAHLLRGEDLDASSASVIESVRLAETLASMRGRWLPGLAELNEASLAVLCQGNDAPMRLIHRRLIVGEAMGAVPEETPAVPLQQDLLREQKRLRLAAEADERALDLDLRKETDLERSYLLHRLGLLGIAWGAAERVHGKAGTFHEVWRLQWKPEFAVDVIAAAAWGNTVMDAAAAYARDAAEKAGGLPAITTLLEKVLLSNLSDAVEHVMRRVQAISAVASDVTHLMAALPPMAGVMRYGNVRQTDTGMIAHVIDGLVTRICIGLPPATASLNDEAAAAMFGHVMSTNAAVSLLQNPEHLSAWQGVLRQLADQENLHGLVAGRAVRLLLNGGVFSADEAARRMGLALSPGGEPSHAAAWVEGFLKGSGLLLLHDEPLWAVIDRWVSELPGETFTAVLPLLRRTFSTFAPPERRQMGERVRRGRIGQAAQAADAEAIDAARAGAVLPLIRMLLGV